MDTIFLAKSIFEILVLWIVIYHVLLIFEGTRAIQVLRGIIFLLAAFFVSQRLGLEVLDWLLTKLFAISVIAILIIFHPEIRQGLARLGRRHIFVTSLKDEELDFILREIIKSLENIAKQKIGALIAIEKRDSLNQYIDSGVVIDAKVSAELIQTIFTPNNLLHDGGLIIQHGRIIAAGCIFPLSQKPDLNRIFGTRHRAALGLSEETDAISIILSEERQDVSVIYRGKIYKDLSDEELLQKLKEMITFNDDDI